MGKDTEIKEIRAGRVRMEKEARAARMARETKEEEKKVWSLGSVMEQ